MYITLFKKYNLFYKLYNSVSHNKRIIRGKHNVFRVDKYVVLRRTLVNIKGNHNSISFLENSSFRNVNIDIIGSNNSLSIGKNCEIVNSNITIVGDGCSVSIGSDTSIIGPCKVYCAEHSNKIKIGNNCLVGFGSVIMSSDAHSITDNDGTILNHGKPVLIGNSVWVGSNVTILKGTEIADGCVIGSNSFLANKNLDCSRCLYINDGIILKREICWSKSLEQ